MPLRKYKFNLIAHISRCEANYYRLCRLLSQANRRELASRSVVIDGHQFELHFQVHQTGTFSTEVELSQQNPDGIPELRMKVHVCHDLQTAEVVSYQGHHRFRVVYPYPNPAMHLPNEKELVNKFLTELLKLCLTDGLVSERELLEMGVLASR